MISSSRLLPTRCMANQRTTTQQQLQQQRQNRVLYHLSRIYIYVCVCRVDSDVYEVMSMPRATQVQFSMLDQRPLNTMAPYCAEKGIGILAYGALAGGYLTERYLDKPPPQKRPETASLVRMNSDGTAAVLWSR